MTAIKWDAALYDARHKFVADLAADLLDLLEPKPGELVLDLGCGTGRMINELEKRGARVIGIDSDPQMVKAAKERAPASDVRIGDARELAGIDRVDAILSNATLHWVTPAEAAVKAMARVLAPGGRLVVEFGGFGNVSSIMRALPVALARVGVDAEKVVFPWYYPRVGEYTSLLEKNGFEVRAAWLFDRPTKLDEGTKGLANWLQMFVPQLLALAPEATREQVIREVEDACRAKLWHDDRWEQDYVRIRVVAIRATRVT